MTPVLVVIRHSYDLPALVTGESVVRLVSAGDEMLTRGLFLGHDNRMLLTNPEFDFLFCSHLFDEQES